jgi:predicted RNA methylase
MIQIKQAAASLKADAIHRAALSIADALTAGHSVTRAMLNAAMATAFGATNASGAWSQRDSFEMLEHATVLAILNGQAVRGDWTVDSIQALAKRLPTQTVRSEAQVVLQQFSTPLDIAWFVGRAGCISPSDTVLEPSAGTGLLALTGNQAGASLILNELDPLRHQLLMRSFTAAKHLACDGAQIDVHVGDDRPSVVLMNPPFSKRAGGHDDHFAAFRHLQAALRALRPNGRLVAIMPDWFTPNASSERAYRACLEGVCLVGNFRVDRGSFAKHGTSVGVRMVVIDKYPSSGAGPAICINRPTIGALVPHLAALPTRRDQTVSPATTAFAPAALLRQSSPPALFSGFAKRATALSPKLAAAKTNPTPALVAYTALAEPAPTGEQVGVYLPYRPSRMAFGAAGDHPTPLVESIAMGSIAAPIPTYVPLLPECCVTAKLLSAAQLETIVYAGQSHERYLAGTYSLDKDGTALVPDAEGRAHRTGYFLGDGTGTGKGRQVAGIILDNWLKGRKRAIWISENETLLEDARRDWSALGGIGIDIQPLSHWSLGSAVTLAEGILFVSYPTLRSQRAEATRLRQILDWARADFDGVIIFDEAHAMGGVAGGQGAFGTVKGSEQGLAGVALQHNLPEARVVYASATGASDINNLAYAVRLGLWGPETAFVNRESFMSAIRQGGIAAMELVARDLKALGLYTARALSYAGVEYDILEHELTPEQISIYDTYAEAWAIIHQNMEDALGITGVVDRLEGNTLNAQAKGAARSRFESCKQRFFGQLLITMKLPSLLTAIDEHIAQGQAVVIQLVSTAESILNRRLIDSEPGAFADNPIDLSPLEYIADYLTRAFPTRMMESFFDDDGFERSRPAYDADGNPLHCPQAEHMRDTLLEYLCAMPPIATALDAITTRFGTDKVAEVTGRTRRLIVSAQGEQSLQRRSSRANLSETAAFMNGDKDILIFSDAGGTGRSYHASLDARNRKRRVHFLLEPGWRADKAIQGLGRTHRTHQLSAPLFRPVTTDCRGERRFISTIARRLDALGALTRGQRQTGGQNLFNPADNLESDYAKAALVAWFHLLERGKLKSCTYADFQTRTGLELKTPEGLMTDKLPTIQRWLNRILALPIALQNAIFDEFVSLTEERIEAARDAGTLDIGVETISVETLTVLDDALLRTDPESGATTHLLNLVVTRRKRVTALAKVMRYAAGSKSAAFMENRKSKSVALRTKATSWLSHDGHSIARFEMTGPTRQFTMPAEDMKESNWRVISEASFVAKWEAAEAKARSELDTDTLYIATGLLLPIWHKLPSDFREVHRITTDDGQSILGRIILDQDVPQLRTALGVTGSIQLSPEAIVAAVMSGKTMTIGGTDSLMAKRSRVNGEQRVELVGADPRRLDWYKAKGCVTEIIQYRTRLFVPTEQAQSIMAQIAKAAA